MVDRYDEQLLLGYVEGDLTPEQAAEFERLLKQDPKLRQLAVQLHADREGLRKIPSQNPGPELMERIEQQLERQMLLDPARTNNRPNNGKNHMRWVPWATYLGVAAMIVIAGGIVLRTLVDSDVINGATGKNATTADSLARRSGGPATSPGELALNKDREELLSDQHFKQSSAKPSAPAASAPPVLDALKPSAGFGNVPMETENKKLAEKAGAVGGFGAEAPRSNAAAKARSLEKGTASLKAEEAARKVDALEASKENALRSEIAPAAPPAAAPVVTAAPVATPAPSGEAAAVIADNSSSNITKQQNTVSNSQRQELGGALQRNTFRPMTRSDLAIHVTTADPVATAKFIANWVTENQISATDAAGSQSSANAPESQVKTKAPAADESDAKDRDKRADVAKTIPVNEAATSNATLGIAGFSDNGKMLVPLKPAQITQLLTALNALPDHAANVQPVALGGAASSDKSDKNAPAANEETAQLVPVILETKIVPK